MVIVNVYEKVVAEPVSGQNSVQEVIDLADYPYPTTLRVFTDY